MHEIYVYDASSIDKFVTKKLLEFWLDDISINTQLTKRDILLQAKHKQLIDNSVILLGMGSPMRSGIEFIKQLSKINNGFHIYIITSFLNNDTIQKLRSTSLVKDCIAKPIEKIDVLKIARENKIPLSKWV